VNRYRRRDAAPVASLPSGDPLRKVSTQATQLVAAFFGLSVLFFVLTAIADAQYPGSITIYVWGRAITELVLGVAYFLFAYLWRRGKFWGYLRMLMTSALALLSTLSVVFFEGSYPWWLRVEQAVQAVVILLLAYLLTRPRMRARFRKKNT
jgi:cell division protein FtsW (lipid II flippase)